MKTKHAITTQGPWSLRKRENAGGGYYIDPVIGEVYGGGHNEANARLVAAAPRMLEILERIAASCEAMLAGDDCDPYDMAEAIRTDARTVIAEATVAQWSGSPDPADPDNFWIDDETGERVNATTGERTAARAE